METINRVEIPEGITVTREGSRLKISGPKGTVEREFFHPAIKVEVKEGEVLISTAETRKKIVALNGTYAAHIRNMCQSVKEGVTYRMKVVYSHFPIQIKTTGNRLEIVNFLGEKYPRYARIEDGVKVAVGGDEITLTGIDRERVGITASNIERATRIRKRDPRVFQDGVYLVERV